MKSFRRIVSFVAIFSLLISYLPYFNLAERAYAEGPIEIDSCSELEMIGQDADYPLSADYVLMNDINCTEIVMTPIGIDSDNPFSGTFDGNNKTISNMVIATDDYEYIGLFGWIESNYYDPAYVINLNLSGGSVSGNNAAGYSSMGSLVGRLNSGIIAGISSDVTVTGGANTKAVGGVVGNLVNEASVIQCSYAGDVTSAHTGTTTDAGVGGLVGKIHTGNIRNSFVASSATVTGINLAGGLVGRIYNGCLGCNSPYVKKSFFDGSVNITGNYAGGLVGSISGNGASIEYSVSTGSVAASNYEGGLYGYVSNLVENENYYDTSETGQTYAFNSTAGNTGEESNWYGNAPSAPLSAWNFDTIWTSTIGALPTLQSVSKTAPDTPADFSTTFDSGIFEFSFTEPTAGNVSLDIDYEVWAKKSSVDWDDLDGYESWSGDVTSSYIYADQSDNTFEDATDYDLRVRSVNLFGGSDWVSVNDLNTGGVDPAIGFAGGDGSAENPYQIENCQQLQLIDNNLTAYYILNEDIDCSMTNPSDEDFDADGPWSNGLGFSPIGTCNMGEGCSEGTEYFAGSLNGNWKIITGLYIERHDKFDNDAALFAAIDDGDADYEVYNLGLEDVYISGEVFSGALAVYVNESVIHHVYSTGRVHSEYGAGGIIGYNEGILSESYSNADVISDQNSVGGLVGYNDNEIRNSFSSGTVTGDYNIGGLAGSSSGSISNSYSSASVKAYTDTAGGLISYDYGNGLENTFCVGEVTIDNEDYSEAGGMIGVGSESYDYATSNNWWYNGWEIGVGGSPEGQPLRAESTAVFQNNNVNEPLAAWNFDSIWSIRENDYPKLSWLANMYRDTDVTGPTKETFIINNDDDYTNSRDVDLTISAGDDKNTVDYMMISASSDFTGDVWENYSEVKDYTLSEGDGEKILYIKFKDSVGNESPTYSDTIILDTTVDLTFSNDSGTDFTTNDEGKRFTYDKKPTFSGTGEPYATVTILINSDPITGTTTVDTEGHWSWTPSQDIPLGDHTVTITIQDLAGNIYQTTFVLGVMDAELANSGSNSMILLSIGVGLLITIMCGFRAKRIILN